MRDRAHTTKFERELSTLKDDGSSLLLVGTIPHARFYDVAVQLLGDATRSPRRRILLGPEDGIDAQIEQLSAEPGLLDSNHVRAIEMGTQTRSATTQSVGSTPGIPKATVPQTDPETIARQVEEEVTQFEREVGALEPAELRVGVDGVTGMLDIHGEETVFKLVHLLNAIVTKRAGMIHYILPLERDSVTVRTFETLFDVIVELRVQSGQVEQRWELLDSGLASEWVALENWEEAPQQGLESGSGGGEA